MARGKHATSAAATRAREDAISEAEALRHQLTKATKENTELTATLTSEREASAERTREFSRQLEASSTPAIEALQQRLSDAEQRASNALHEVALSLLPIFERPDFKATIGFQSALIEALGVSAAEFYKWGAESRYARRMSPAKLRQRAGDRQYAKANGSAGF